ncbi:hypothetical protein [Nocardioides sp. LHG3406-4]|uniref:hypothetical protein n=1 Tax=Nocardioides sp. LHG3406-4 TaxID=2804575 RepID=UPI003CF7E723
MRTIDVTAGAKEFVTAALAEKNDASLAGATFEVSLGSSTTKAPDDGWQAPDEQEVTGSTASVSLLIDNADQIGRWYLWVKLTDSPEVILLACRNDSISVV